MHDEFLEYVHEVLDNLQDSDFQFCVLAEEDYWDVYRFQTTDNGVGTIAFRLIGEGETAYLDIGLFREGMFSPDEVIDVIQENVAASLKPVQVLDPSKLN